MVALHHYRWTTVAIYVSHPIANLVDKKSKDELKKIREDVPTVSFAKLHSYIPTYPTYISRYIPT